MNITPTLSSIPKPKARTNAKNTGKPFEEEIRLACANYDGLGLACIEKVEPPVKVVGSKQERRVIFLENPFLDFTGAISGRRIDFEAKSTEKNYLSIGKKNKLNDDQIASMDRWDYNGSIVFLLWKVEGRNQVALVPYRKIRHEYAMGAKSLIFDDYTEWFISGKIDVAQGKQWWDFLPLVGEAK